MLVYLGIAVFCVVFAVVYENFSHGVSSAWMVWLFAWPLGIGAVPYAVTVIASRHASAPGRPGMDWARLAHHAGVACLTLGSCLTGVFAIYGTSSPWLLGAYWLTGSLCLAVALLLASIARPT